MNGKIDVLEQTEHGKVTEGDYREGNRMRLGETSADRVNDGENDFGESISETAISGEDPVRTLDALIEKLPSNFPHALPLIREEIAPILATCQPGLVEHYVQVIKKRTKAATKRAITLEIDSVKRRMYSEESEITKSEEVDSEAEKLAQEIAHDPLLFKKRIDLVNRLGVVREKRALGLYFVTLDSRLIPMGLGGSHAIALKNSGTYGGGKSHPLSMCLEIYPKDAYHLISGGSPKSLYYLKDGLKHKALIIVEAFSFQTTNPADSEFAYVARSLISEGSASYQYSSWDSEGNKITKVKKLEGPTSFITTSVRGNLEPQLEDRLLSVHPDTSSRQTKEILSLTGDQASGISGELDRRTIEAWKRFHQLLEPSDVVIPFARDISNYLAKSETLPIAARRAFKRVLSAIKTVALSHQHQRQRDEYGRFIAEMCDYAIVYQLIKEPFLERLREQKSHTEPRMRVIANEGTITLKELARREFITVPALTPWVKERVERGVLTWCDEKGREFPSRVDLRIAKHSGKAFIRVAQPSGLPSPFDLTGDPRWDVGGELFERYDLGIEGEDGADSGDGKLTHSLNTSDDGYPFDNIKESLEKQGGVKVLSENSGVYEKKGMEDHNEEVVETANIDWRTLSDEFGEILTKDHNKKSGQSTAKN